MFDGGSGKRAGRRLDSTRKGLRAMCAVAMSFVLNMTTAAVAAPSMQAGKTPAPEGKGVGAPALSWAKPTNPAAKITPDVAAAFGKSEQVTYLVHMRMKADVDQVAANARQSATPAQRDLQARSAVIGALQEAADRSQQNLLSMLSDFQAKGQVSEFQSYWIANMVVVTSTKNVMESIAKLPEVERIYPNEEIHLVSIAPKGPGVQAPGPGAAKGPAPGAAKEDIAPAVEPPKVEAAPDNKVQNIEWNITRVGAPGVWEQYGIDGAGVVVATMDTGVDPNHPALQAQYRGNTVGHAFAWFDAVNGQSQPYDDHGHGTHVTGTMVGRDADGANQIGVAPGAQWMGVKMLNAAGSGSTANILTAGQWLVAPGGDPSKAPDVVNNSWGGGSNIDDWFRDVVNAWRAAGIVPVFAAGNSGPGAGSVSNPGNYPESFTVGATDSADNLAGFSGRGPSAYGVMKPEVSAPGVNIRSAVPGGGYQGGWSGTSMAAPHVAGAAALLRSADASLSVETIEMILMESADPRTDGAYPESPNNGYGHGIINAHTAVGMVISGVGSISGRVLASGDDLVPPAITHTPVTEAFRHTPIDILARVTDNVSVTAVQLRFRLPGMTWWGVVDMNRVNGDHRDGMYSGTIPPEMVAGDRVEYYIEALDFGGNRAYSGRSNNPHRVDLIDGLTPGYLQDFEGSVVGWTSGGSNDPWQIGEPTSGPGNAHSGTRVAATNLSGNYPDNVEAYLMSPPIDLSGGGAALRFWQWYNIEAFWDNAYVLVSGDGGFTWDILAQYTGSNTNWHEVILDLGPYAGNPAVFVAFYLSTDFSVQYPGWYIDDFEVYRGDEGPAAPTNLQAEPTSVGGIGLTWTASASSDLAFYSVYRSTTSGSGYSHIGDTTNTNFNDTNVTAGTTYYYVVSGTNIFGVEGDMSVEASATPSSVDVRFSDDMESGQGGWTVTGGHWELGAPTSGPGHAASGSNLWATILAGPYDNNANAHLISPPIDLTGLGSASLQFTHWYEIENNWDFGHVEISTNGGSTWTELARYTGLNRQWNNVLIDLSGHVGHEVQVRFRFRSDGSVVYAGWYIDDVTVAGVSTSGMDLSLANSHKGEPLKMKIGVSSKPALVTPQIDTKTASSISMQVSAADIGIMALPLEATVTVVETGRVVRTDPASGNFNLTLPAGTYTLLAEAYGFYSQTASVTVDDGSEASHIFLLQPMPRGVLQGQITDSRTGEPIAGASVTLVEDSRVAPAMTDASGIFQMNPLVGDYTVNIRAQGYYGDSAQVTVTEGATTTLDVALRPFIGMTGEIAYDDGTAENAWGFYDAGNGWAVRMSTMSGQTALVMGARIYLWDSSWPSPGGNSFRAAIYAANSDGTPGALLAGPITVNNAVRGAWNDVDFSEYGISIAGDFFVAFIQDQPFPNTPGMAVDESNPDTGRNYQLVSGSWSRWMDGNMMIRALVAYEVAPPTITSPADGTHTNVAEHNVLGHSAAGTLVTLYNNGVEVGSATASDSGAFSIPVTLEEGDNALTATATVTGDGAGSGTTDPSDPIMVVLDTQAPDITLTAPADGQRQQNRILTVTGTVAEENLSSLTVNGQAASVGNDGSFTKEVIGQEGENIVTVTATDLAGNSTTVQRTVYVDSQAPVISNPEPASNITAPAGSTVTLRFESDADLALAAYQVVLGAGTASHKTTKNGLLSLEPGEVAMTQVSPGVYEGQWTIPNGTTGLTFHIRFRVVDESGNEARATAPGNITVGEGGGGGGDDGGSGDDPTGQPPVAEINGPTQGRVDRRINFQGNRSYDPDGRIDSYSWNMGDGTVISGMNIGHRYAAAGTYTITLTVTDNDGNTGTATHSIQILP